jgi:hypothetical protein
MAKKLYLGNTFIYHWRPFMKKHLILALLTLTLIVSSCNNLTDSSDDVAVDYVPNNPGVPISTTRNFWARNFNDGTFYTLRAQKLAEGENCTVWAEAGSGVDASTAQSLVKIYDGNIYSKMINAFSIGSFIYSGRRYNNTIALADSFGDRDGKLLILILDIRDSFNPTTGGFALEGYFSWINLYRNDPNDNLLKYSNECDMIY